MSIEIIQNGIVVSPASDGIGNRVYGWIDDAFKIDESMAPVFRSGLSPGPAQIVAKYATGWSLCAWRASSITVFPQ
jgi:hypothetical protein